MPALQTFDWFKNEVWSRVNDDTRRYLEQQRDYLLILRNENERRRLLESVMEEVKAVQRKSRA